jgi:hypothetical protein
MSDAAFCGCCACLAGAGEHVAVTNRPGLSALRTRIGTHATFLEAMIRRLTVPVVPSDPYSLHALTTRQPDDPSIALLDAWATVADVLTFYQERYANEGYLRTATERRSLLELGRLVGYALRPGVAASVYLAYTLEATAKTVIPAGSKAQSIPGPDEQPQTFETSEDIEARGLWNALRPRMRRPQDITMQNVVTIDSVWIAGTTTRIDARDPLLFVFLDERNDERKEAYALRRALKTNLDTEHDRTEIVLEPMRPYYRNLNDATWHVIAVFQKMLAALPAAGGATTQPKPTKRRVRRGTPAAATTTVLTAENLDAFLSRLTNLAFDLLLGVPRDTLQQRHGRLAPNDPIPELVPFVAAFKAEDVDDPITPPKRGILSIAELLPALARARAIAPGGEFELSRSLAASLNARSDYVPRLMANFLPQIGTSIYTALANAALDVGPAPPLQSLHVLRRRASVFGYNAPAALFEERLTNVEPPQPWPAKVVEDPKVLYLDTPDDAVRVDSYVVATVTDPDSGIQPPVVRKVLSSETVTRTAYSVTGKTTRLALNDTWSNIATTTEKKTSDTTPTSHNNNLAIIRNTAVLAESELLPLAQQPVARPVGKPHTKNDEVDESETRIELDAVVDGLTPGRWVIVTGERADTLGTTGVMSAELAMIADVEQQSEPGPRGTPYSVLLLAPDGLAYRYKRDTVSILANVAKATHGETRQEILGGGDGAQSLQTFTLRQSPLTYTSAATQDGVVSTLAVRVNELLWHETDSLAGSAPADRVYLTKRNDDGKTSLTFGTGREGARLPTGSDNVRAVYRSGIGKSGNVRARQVATAISRAAGVRDVVNPIEAGGGADPESRDDARRNIPVSLQAMGRIVSVSDYADFARTFAGIAKASAVPLSDGRQTLVHLTVGGIGDVDVAPTSDLYRNLVTALRNFGDPNQPFVVAARDKMIVAGSAGVRVAPDFLWSLVAPKIRAALLEAFSYDRRDFGRPVYPSEVVAAIQSVPGVAYVDLDALGAVRPAQIAEDGHLPKIDGVHTLNPQLAHRGHRGLRPAEIAYLPAELIDLFILTEIPNV